MTGSNALMAPTNRTDAQRCAPRVEGHPGLPDALRRRRVIRTRGCRLLDDAKAKR
jgi:hypothetical protein